MPGIKKTIPVDKLNGSGSMVSERGNTMTKHEAKCEFAVSAVEVLKSKDYPAIREGWNNYVDSLRKDGRITQKQAETWVNPFLSKNQR